MALDIKDKSWQDIASAMKTHRDETIANVTPAVPDVPKDLPLNVTSIPAKLLSKEEIQLTESAPETLLSSLASGELSCTALTTAFLRRAGLAQKLVNCVTELLTSKALERAKFLDDYLAEHKKPSGPLHGLPTSVKEHIGMKDLNLNAGFISWCDRVGADDALILKLLWNAGAVFYVRTTQPQSLMHLETSSNLYGVTVNPFNSKLTPGGSSGGEGALIGLRGSCLGIGTDIGGSIRSPAANNGLFGLRPTSFRLPVTGWSATMAGCEAIIAVIGPLSTSLSGISIFMKTLLDSKPWLHEPSLIPIPWSPSPPNTTKKLKIGILANDGVVKPHPPILRAIKSITTALSKCPEEIELVPFPPLDHAKAWHIISSLYFADGGAQEAAAIDASSEPWRPLTNFIIKDNPNCKPRSVTEAWELQAERDAYRAAYSDHWNSVSGSVEGGDLVDVILCPVGPGAAPPIDCARYWGYTAQWNLLDYPALVFPTGTSVDPDVDVVEEGYVASNTEDEYNYKLCEYFVQALELPSKFLILFTDASEEGPERYRDAPISLQLVGRRYEDEKVIAAMEKIAKLAGLPLAV